MQPVQARGALETVRSLCQRINEVMIYAQNTGLIDAVPSINIGKAFEKPQKKNMPSIQPDQLPKLMQTMRTASINLSTRCLFMWQLLTITRPAEAAEARWEEIDTKAREWKIPASRMKMNRDHTVPLSDEAIAVLEMMKPLSGNREFIFPSRIKPSQPMNSQTVNASLKRAGFGGFSFRMVCDLSPIQHLMSKAFHLMLLRLHWHMWIRMKFVALITAAITLSNDVQ